MLCVVLLVFTISGRCRGDNNSSSSSSPLLLLPPPTVSRRMAAAQVDSLRRQLMRDNYDYQHSDAERTQPHTTPSTDGGRAKFYHQKSGTNLLPRAAELGANSDAFSAERGQRGFNEQHGQREQGRQNKQNAQHKQPRLYEQPGEYEYRDQYEQPGEYEHHGQYKQRRQYEQRDPRQQSEHRDRYEQHRQDKEREQHEHRGQEQLGQQEPFDELEQAQSIEHRDRAAPPLTNAPAAVRFTDVLAVRDVYESMYTLDRRDITPDQARNYNPSNYNKRKDPYDPPYPLTQVQARPFGDLRGNHNEQYRQNDAGKVQEEQETQTPKSDVHSPDQEYTPDEQESFDQQDVSGSEDDGGSDFSESKEQPHRDHNSPPHRDLNVLPQGVRNPPPRRASNTPLDQNISKKDLLYHMDDTKLRHRNHEISPEVPHVDQPAVDELPAPQRSTGPNSSVGSLASPTGTRASLSDTSKFARRPAPSKPPDLQRTERVYRSFVVTVSAANVTYKLLSLKTREGRRQAPRRFLEERAPGRVAIISLDHAPLPGFRLPRARRQYMHEPQLHHRSHAPA